MSLSQIVKSAIPVYPDWPTPGIQYMNTVELCNDPKAFAASVQWYTDIAKKVKAESIFAADARGFIWAGPVAVNLGIPMYTVRKPGKMPGAVLSQEYELEYGKDRLELSTSVPKNDRPILIIDDVLATGGTAEAIAKLVWRSGVSQHNINIAVLVNLTFLPGRTVLESKQHNVYSLIDV